MAQRVWLRAMSRGVGRASSGRVDHAPLDRLLVARAARLHSDRDRLEMKDFSNASFSPEIISVMQDALDAAIASLPDPVSATHIRSLAETILRSAREGERDPATLQRLALLELQIVPRD
jgi:hypothetical protein